MCITFVLLLNFLSGIFSLAVNAHISFRFTLACQPCPQFWFRTSEVWLGFPPRQQFDHWKHSALEIEHPICGLDNGQAGQCINAFGPVFICLHVSKGAPLDYCQLLSTGQDWSRLKKTNRPDLWIALILDVFIKLMFTVVRLIISGIAALRRFPDCLCTSSW